MSSTRKKIHSLCCAMPGSDECQRVTDLLDDMESEAQRDLLEQIEGRLAMYLRGPHGLLISEEIRKELLAVVLDRPLENM